MPLIGGKDINRIFAELNAGVLAKEDKEGEFASEWLEKTFDESGIEWLNGLIPSEFGSSLQKTEDLMGDNFDPVNAIHITVIAYFISGVMLGWTLKEQYGSDGTPFDQDTS